MLSLSAAGLKRANCGAVSGWWLVAILATCVGPISHQPSGDSFALCPNSLLIYQMMGNGWMAKFMLGWVLICFDIPWLVGFGLSSD